MVIHQIVTARATGSSDVPTLEDSGYQGVVRITADSNLSPVVFMWWASTPTGRVSVYTQTCVMYRTRAANKLKKVDGKLCQIVVPSQYFATETSELCEAAQKRSYALLPSLPAGYVWQGPFLALDTKAPSREGVNGSSYFMYNEPEKSDALENRFKGGLASLQNLAAGILRRKGVTA